MRQAVHRPRVGGRGVRSAGSPLPSRDLVIGDPATRPRISDRWPAPTSPRTSHGRCEASVAAGAKALTGGERLERGPAWYAPTVLVNVTLEMPVMAEETFGPAAAVIAFADGRRGRRDRQRHAVRAGGKRLVARQRARTRGGTTHHSGALFINANTASDPRLPFGGVKQSGYGRELGEAGATEFTNIRTVLVG